MSRKHWIAAVTKLLVVVGLAFLICWPVAYLLRFAKACRPVTKSHIADWEDFYAREFSLYFRLPKEARIALAQETREPFGGHSIVVTFRLPRTRPHRVWVKLIAVQSGLGGYKRSDFLYDAGGDGWRIQYKPKLDLYEAVHSWD